MKHGLPSDAQLFFQGLMLLALLVVTYSLAFRLRS